MTIDPKDYDGRVLDFLRADWTIELHRNEDGMLYAGVVELPGCMTEADSALRLSMVERLTDRFSRVERFPYQAS